MMGWMFTVALSAFLGRTLALAAVRRRQVFSYRCKGCGEHITIMDMGILSAACPGCGRVTQKDYDGTVSALHQAGRKRIEAKVQFIAAIAAGTMGGFLYGFFL